MLAAACGLAFIQGYHRSKPAAERLEVVKLFVDLGVDVNQADDYGITPLMAAANMGDTKMIQYLVDKGANLAAYDLGKKNDGAFGASVEPLLPVDYAIGVGTFVPNNAIIMHDEAVALMMKMMEERGIKHTTSECTLRGFTCAQADVDPKVATPSQIQRIRALQTGNQVQGITGGWLQKRRRRSRFVHQVRWTSTFPNSSNPGKPGPPRWGVSWRARLPPAMSSWLRRASGSSIRRSISCQHWLRWRLLPVSRRAPRWPTRFTPVSSCQSLVTIVSPRLPAAKPSPRWDSRRMTWPSSTPENCRAARHGSALSPAMASPSGVRRGSGEIVSHSAVVVGLEQQGLTLETIQTAALPGFICGHLHLETVTFSEIGSPLPIMARVRTLLAGAGVGMGRRALREALHIARTQTYRGAGGEQTVQGLLADAATELDAAAMLTYKAATMPVPSLADASMAKLAATEATQRAVVRATQVVGADSLRGGHVVERLAQDVRALELFAGRTEALREAVAAAALPH